MKLVWEGLSDSYRRVYQLVVGGVWNTCGRTRGVLLNAVGSGYQMLERGIIKCSRKHFQLVIGNWRECFQRGCPQFRWGDILFQDIVKGMLFSWLKALIRMIDTSVYPGAKLCWACWRGKNVYFRRVETRLHALVWRWTLTPYISHLARTKSWHSVYTEQVAICYQNYCPRSSRWPS